MSNIKKYSYSEILSFYSPCDPPEYFQNNCPIFTPQSQEPVTISNSKPNLNFTPKPFNFVPKKAQGSDSSSESGQKPSPPSKIIDFRPQILKSEKNKSNVVDDTEINANYSNQLNRYRFSPESIGKPTSSSAPPVTIVDSNQNNNQNQTVNNVLNFKPQKDVSNQEVKKIEPQNNANEEKNTNQNPSVFKPQKEEKKIEVQKDNSKLNNIEEENKNEDQKESQSKDNKKATPWANISVKPLIKSDASEKVNSVQVQLQKEIDNSLISSVNNSSDDNQKARVHAGFAPKKLDQTYEAPELPADKPSDSKQTRKTLTNFDEIEKEEINQSQKQNQQEQQQKKGLFESLLEQEKKNQSKNVKKEIIEDNEPKKPNIQKVGFAPKQAAQFYEGPSIEELNKPNNASNNTKENKSGFSALMEQEKVSSEKEKREKEKEKQNNNVKKPSIVDILINETMQEKSKEEPKPKEEEVPEEKPSFQAFKPIRAQESYEAPSLEEIESYSKKPQKKTTFSDALSNQNQNEFKNKSNKPSFEELQKNESSKQVQAKKQGSFSNAPSFFDLLVKEEKKEKEILQSAKNNDANKDEQKSVQPTTTGFNPKRNRPDTGSFSEMLNKEKQKQKKENQSKINAPTTVNVNVRSGSKFTGNYPSFAQLINDEARLEEQRTMSIPPMGSVPLSSKNASFQQKVADEEVRADATTIGDFVSVQGEMPKKWANKKGRGKKRGGRGGNTRTEETTDLFWGAPANFDDNEINDDQVEQNWPSVQDQNETDESTSFGFEKDRSSQKKDARVSWLSNVLEEELGEENPWEFAESLVNKSKNEMIRFLSTVTFDQRQASNIATRFFQIFPTK